MSLLSQTRDEFIATTQRYVDGESLRSIVAVLDHLIEWTQREFPMSVPAKAGDQSTVAFTFSEGGEVFWRAYPRRQDGAKVVVLSGLADAMAPEARAALAEVLAFVHDGSRIAPGAVFQIALSDLARTDRLERFLLFQRVAGSATVAYLDTRSST